MARVLIAEDSRLQAEQYRVWLEDGHYEVTIAENGLQALEAISEDPPDVVLTDLQMPGMDGLELLHRLHFQYPEIPVILMTAHGSEELANEALQQGAAAYVPKAQVETALVATVDQVVGLMRAERGYAGLLSCLTRNEFSFELTSDPGLIGPLGDLIQQMLRALEFGDAIIRVRIGMALEHALLNALFHGTLELGREELAADWGALSAARSPVVVQRRDSAPFRDRRIAFSAYLTRDEARFTIQDEGPGFDTSQLPSPADATALEREGGRGLLLMRSFMDQVDFNDRGNEVTLIKLARRTA